MKAILEYTLPEEEKDINRALQSFKMTCVLFDFIYNTRKRLEAETDGKDSYETIEAVYRTLFDSLQEHGLIIDNLIE